MRTSQISKLYLAKTKNLKHENIFLSAKPFQRAEEWDCRWEKQFIKKNLFNLHFALILPGWPEKEQIKRDFFAGIQVLSFAKSWVGRNAQRNQGGAGEQVKGGGERLLVSTSILIGG